MTNFNGVPGLSDWQQWQENLQRNLEVLVRNVVPKPEESPGPGGMSLGDENSLKILVDGGGVRIQNGQGGTITSITGGGGSIITGGFGNGFNNVICGNNNRCGSMIQVGNGNVMRLVGSGDGATTSIGSVNITTFANSSSPGRSTGPYVVNGHLIWCDGGSGTSLVTGNGRCLFRVFVTTKNSEFLWSTDQNTVKIFMDGLEMTVQPRSGTPREDFRASLRDGWLEISLPI